MQKWKQTLSKGALCALRSTQGYLHQLTKALRAMFSSSKNQLGVFQGVGFALINTLLKFRRSAGTLKVGIW